MKNSGTKAKKIRHTWPKCFLRLQKNGLMIGFWKKRLSSYCSDLSAKIIQNWRQTFWLKCLWVNLSVQGNNLREVTFWRRMKFCDNFVLWAKRFRNFNKKMHARLSKVSSYVSRLTFWGIFSKKFHFLSTFSENEQKAIQLLAEIFRHAFQKCIWSLQRNILRLFLKKVQLFHLFWTLSSKIYPTFAENLRQACQKCIIGVRGNNLRKKNFFGKNTCFFYCYWTSSQFLFGKSTKIFDHGCPNCSLRIQGKSRSRKFFLEKNIFSLMFVTLEKKNWECWQKNVCRVVKTVFYVARGTLWVLFWRRYTSSRRFRNMNKKLSNFWRK